MYPSLQGHSSSQFPQRRKKVQSIHQILARKIEQVSLFKFLSTCTQYPFSKLTVFGCRCPKKRFFSSSSHSPNSVYNIKSSQQAKMTMPKMTRLFVILLQLLLFSNCNCAPAPTITPISRANFGKAFRGNCSVGYSLDHVKVGNVWRDVCTDDTAISPLVNACYDGFIFSSETFSCHNFDCYLSSKKSGNVDSYTNYISKCFKTGSCQWSGWIDLFPEKKPTKVALMQYFGNGLGLCYNEQECGKFIADQSECVLKPKCPEYALPVGDNCLLSCPFDLHLDSDRHRCVGNFLDPFCPDGAFLRPDFYCEWVVDSFSI